MRFALRNFVKLFTERFNSSELSIESKDFRVLLCWTPLAILPLNASADDGL
jgi:hypothetical protein